MLGLPVGEGWGGGGGGVEGGVGIGGTTRVRRVLGVVDILFGGW